MAIAVVKEWIKYKPLCIVTTILELKTNINSVDVGDRRGERFFRCRRPHF